MRKKILIIEDNKDNREILLEFLSAYGFDVAGAADGKEGLDNFIIEKPDLVLSDVLLPKVNGFGVCQTIKESPDRVPVILMSALYKTHALQSEAKEKYGADEYILKPLNLVNLATTICTLLGISKADLAAGREKAKSASGPPDEGSFSQFPAPLVLAYLYQNRHTGILSCSGKAKKTLYLHEGVPLYVNSDDPAETYTELMITEKVIAKDKMADLEARANSSQTPLSKLLLSEKVISGEQLTHFMLTEVHERLIDLVTWQDGTYKFASDDSFLKKVKRPPMAMARSIYHGIKRGDFSGFVAYRYIPFKEVVVQKNASNLVLVAELDMEAEDLETFALIDGEVNLSELLEQTPQPQERAYKVLFALEMLGIISF